MAEASQDWCLDPVVTYGDKLNPTNKSIWDTIEDMDAQAGMQHKKVTCV